MTKKERAKRIAEGKKKAAAKRAENQVKISDFVVEEPRTRSPYEVPSEPCIIRSTHESLFSDGRVTVEVTTYPNRARS